MKGVKFIRWLNNLVNMSEYITKHVRIRILGKRKERDYIKGVYYVMVNGSSYSNKSGEFVVKREYAEKIKEAGVKFKELPLNKK